VIPFGGKTTRHGRTDWFATPLVWGEYDKDSYEWHALPSVEVARREGYAKTSVWPVAGKTKDRERQSEYLLWPLWQVDERGGDYRKVVSFPAFSYWTETGATAEGGAATQPTGTTQEGVATERSKFESPAIFPLLATVERDGETGSGWIGGPLYTWDVKGENDAEHRVLHQLAFRLERPEGMVAGIYPFYYRERNDRGDTSWSIFYDLIQRTTRNGETKWRLLWFLHM